jgi:hypothetical protein
VGCSGNKNPEDSKIEHSKYLFMNTSWTRDAEHDTKTFTLNCIETTDEMDTTIKIVKCDDHSLHLDFNGEIRVFEK